MSDPLEFKPVILAPTFNNARTLARVLRGLDVYQIPVIVVDDGSTDQSSNLLARWAGESPLHVLITHPRNRGKGDALRSGFAHARQTGNTHAVSIDTDGQLDPVDVARLLLVAKRAHGTLIVGWRDPRARDYPLSNRIGRWASNLLVRWESGLRVADSQCGFRVYPLHEIEPLRCTAGRYGYETELLVRVAWAGVPVLESHVSCVYQMPEGRVSHFRRVNDTFYCASMHLRLMLRSLTPWPNRRLAHRSRRTGMVWQRLAWWFSPLQAWRAVRQDPAERSRFAAGLSLGVFVANTPFYGVQTLISLYLARRLRLNPLPVILGSHLSTPPIGPLLIAAAIAVGHWLLYGSLPVLHQLVPVRQSYWSLVRSVLLEWTVGGLACGVTLAAIVYFLTRLLLRCLPVHTPKDPASRPAAQAPVRGREVAESAA